MELMKKFDIFINFTRKDVNIQHKPQKNLIFIDLMQYL